MESNSCGETSLGEVSRMQARVGERVALPPWFHVGLGALVAQHALVQGLDDSNWTMPSFLVLLCGATVLVGLARRGTGLTVAAPRGARSSGIMAARLLVALTCIWTAALIDDPVVVIGAATLVFVATVMLGVAYDEALRRDIIDGASQP
jgi:hypothetical protein